VPSACRTGTRRLRLTRDQEFDLRSLSQRPARPDFTRAFTK
jgi:hypothetical protein